MFILNRINEKISNDTDALNSKKEDLLKFIDDSIKIKSEPMQSSLQSILAV